MWNKIILWFFRVCSIVLVFIAPLVYLIMKYSGKVVVEDTQSSMPVIILLFITVLVLVLIMWLGSQVLVVYWEYVKKHPFGSVSVFTFGTIILALSFLMIQWIDKFTNLIEYNTARFVTDLSTYKGSMSVIIIYVSIGLASAVAGFIWREATEI